MAMFSPWNMINSSRTITFPSPDSPWKPSSIASASSRQFFRPLNCTPPLQEAQQVDSGIMCEPCNGKGWMLCDFCGGQKTNVKAQNKRIYRRCPSCRAIGYVLCQECKVFKCVTFPDYGDGSDTSNSKS